jgi:ubiquinone/menaquinone biosynthesis C-methylase UbiE
MNHLVANMLLDSDGIWGVVADYGNQKDEKELRQSVANKVYGNYLSQISLHHSIPVMDSEVKKFLTGIPKNGVVLDIGGCWGWHWRNISRLRPDITVVIVDLVRENLLHAKQNLKEIIPNNKILLVHGNACSLEFANETFDGIWSVQTTQHIPNFEVACMEVFRVLKPGGIYWDYGLNNALLVRLVYKFFRKTYHLNGVVDGSFFLRRVNGEVINSVEEIFHAEPTIRYSEVLFKPDFGVPIGGKDGSIIGRLDSLLSSGLGVWGLLARQCSFHAQKLN